MSEVVKGKDGHLILKIDVDTEIKRFRELEVLISELNLDINLVAKKPEEGHIQVDGLDISPDAYDGKMDMKYIKNFFNESVGAASGTILAVHEAAGRTDADLKQNYGNQLPKEWINTLWLYVKDIPENEKHNLGYGIKQNIREEQSRQDIAALGA
jgi:hypothetical protein